MSAPKFGLGGDHWKGHGKSVETVPQFQGDGATVSVYSHRDKRYRDGLPTVLLAVSLSPFNLGAHLKPEGARAMAASLVLAADHADLVQAALDLRAAKPSKAVTP